MAHKQEVWLTRAEAAEKLRKHTGSIDRYVKRFPELFKEGVGKDYLGSTPVYALSAFQAMRFKKKGPKPGYKRK